MRDADVAMYRAKDDGRHRFAVFDEHLHNRAMQLLEMESDLRHAIARNEFVPFFQPIVRLSDRNIVGHEALEAKAAALQSRMQGLVFTKAGPVYQTLGLGYLAWNLGPAGGDSVASGFDVAIVRDGVISELYTVITT